MSQHRGASLEQDNRYTDKMKKLRETMKFPPEFSTKVDMEKVNLDVMRPWIAERLEQLLGIEDEVLVEFVFSLLEQQFPDPKEMQIALTGFLEKKTPRFMQELWRLLIDAQQSIAGIPSKFIEEKKREILERRGVDEDSQDKPRTIVMPNMRATEQNRGRAGSESEGRPAQEHMSELERIKLEREEQEAERERRRIERRANQERYHDRSRRYDRDSTDYRRDSRDNYRRRDRSRSRERSFSASRYSKRRERRYYEERDERERDRSRSRSRH